MEDRTEKLAALAASRGPMPVGADRTHPNIPESCAADTLTSGMERERRQPRKLRVSQDDESLLAAPDLQDAAATIQSNNRLLGSISANFQGRTFQEIRRWSRQAVLEAAKTWTSELTGRSVRPGVGDLIVVDGHQPSLFHPGVWIKNFAISKLAAQVAGGTALHLVVDNDLVGSQSIRVPAGTASKPRYETIPFDDARSRRPWEEARIVNQRVFEQFGARVTEAMRHWEIDPIIGEMWPAAIATAERTGSLPTALTAARHGMESKWGIDNLELPISRLCELEPFLWFVGHILVKLEHYRSVHNEVLHEYRRLNGIRSRTHPVPELGQTGAFVEAPFWVWRRGESVRRRVYARQRNRTITLSDGQTEFIQLPLSPEMDLCCAVEALRELSKRGIRLRTRALTTTLFSRICLADIFVHGIGGSKYDEMTDQILYRIFGIEPPGFQTLSATLHLPLVTAHNADPHAAIRRHRDRLRELSWNADRSLGLSTAGDVQDLIAEKQILVAEENLRRHQPEVAADRVRNRTRYQRLRDVNRELAARAANQRHNVQQELAAAEQSLAADRVLHDREYSFALYPQHKLNRLMNQLDVSLPAGPSSSATVTDAGN